MNTRVSPHGAALILLLAAVIVVGPPCSLLAEPVIAHDHGSAVDEVEDEISHYTCSMHPSVRSSEPGTCPICSMNLIPVRRAEVESATIRIDARQRQLIGVTTAVVERKAVELPLRIVGRVTYDESRLTDVTLKFKAWVGEVFADSTGAPVIDGQPLLTVYSPELLSAQEEYLESLRRERTDRRSVGRLVESARARLRLWGVTETQIDTLARRGKPVIYVPIHAPATGVVIDKKVVAGSAVDAGALLYRIVDLSSVWVEGSVYEADLSLVHAGQTATLSLAYLPGESFAAVVDYVYPYLDPETRTGRVRFVLANPAGTLKPEMYVAVKLSVRLGEQIIVPEEAVVRSGETNIVFVDLGEGRLAPRQVELGRRTPMGYVVRDGIEVGATVVTSGSFLIAAESKLKAGVDQW